MFEIDALICSPLNVIVQDGAELCKAMRLNFQSTTEDVDVGSLDCFDGTGNHTTTEPRTHPIT